ncbi:mechanosensitive ion channel domain-containing protein [Aurantibacter crassamenti]|uniref:mechanosensitive ion channel domain-containing protein n=1 Tax=Aurantibacter crassamenti TaxID=1837375 RepID=UPI00293D2A76|nr:mechanosensitive ion channel domain-containing protein [Aurantibacter crassamenti]
MMKVFFEENQSELLGTLICIIVIFLLRFIVTQAINRIGQIRDKNLIRTKMVNKYISFSLVAIGAIILIFIWGVDFKELGLVMSSIFAVIGVALFASWSILSNVTAGIILFFWYPFKIGDRIKVHDSEFSEEALILDIAAFHLHLRKDNGELLTYPNNLLLQKGVVLIEKNAGFDEDIDYDI